MPDDAGRPLEDEARSFGRALLGTTPDDYVADQYARAHRHLPLEPVAPFDRMLLRLAGRGSWGLRAADGYARIFAPASVLRRKLAVLVAILETASPSEGAFAATEEGPAVVLVQLLAAGFGFGLMLGVGVIILAPFHLANRLMGRTA